MAASISSALICLFYLVGLDCRPISVLRRTACALQRLPRLWHQESREISNDRFEGWHFRRPVPGERFPLALLFRVSGEGRRQRVRQILRDHGPGPLKCRRDGPAHAFCIKNITSAQYPGVLPLSCLMAY